MLLAAVPGSIIQKACAPPLAIGHLRGSEGLVSASALPER